jgi:hypothetical protein
MRSVLQNLPFVQKAIVRVPSLPISKPGEPSSSCSIAQVPTWLDIGKTTPVQSKLKLLPYRLFNKNASVAKSMPDAIMQSGDGLSAATQQSDEVDYYLFLTSSQYVRREMSAADFASPLFGPVFRFSSSRRAEDPSSAYDRPLGSGNRQNTHPAQTRIHPAQKNPALAPQSHAPGFSCCVVRMLHAMALTL